MCEAVRRARVLARIERCCGASWRGQERRPADAGVREVRRDRSAHALRRCCAMGAGRSDPKEYDLLLALIRRDGACITRTELLTEVWGYSASDESHGGHACGGAAPKLEPIQPIRSTFSPFAKQAIVWRGERDKSRNARRLHTQGPMSSRRNAWDAGQRPDLRLQPVHGACHHQRRNPFQPGLIPTASASADEMLRPLPASHAAFRSDYATWKRATGRRRSRAETCAA